jgi:hypothetical protein
VVGDHVLVLVRNGLGGSARVRVAAAGLDAAGELTWVAEADSRNWFWVGEQIQVGVQPGVVFAGGVAMAVMQLPDGAPAAATVKYRADAQPEERTALVRESSEDLEVAAARVDGDRLVVEVRNRGSEARDRAGLVAFCLSPDGSIVGLASALHDVSLAKDVSATIEVPLGGQPCENFVVSARDAI